METPDPKYKHKPSEKHTLEEVLKSLQDLIRNDLSEQAPPPAPKEPSSSHPATTAAARELQQHTQPVAPAREDLAAASPESGPVNLNAVMRSLKDLIGNELSAEESPPVASSQPESPHEEYLASGDKIEEYVPEDLEQLEAALSQLESTAPAEPVAEPVREPSAAHEILKDDAIDLQHTLEDEVAALESALGDGSITPETSDVEESITLEGLPADESITLESRSIAEEPPVPEIHPAAPEPGEEISLEAEAADLPRETLADRAESPTEHLAASDEITIDPESPALATDSESFTPLDEELTLDEPLHTKAAPAALVTTTELPGDIDPTLLESPASSEVDQTQPPDLSELPSGTQQEMFFEVALTQRSSPLPEPVPPTPEPPRAAASKLSVPVEPVQETQPEPPIESADPIPPPDVQAKLPETEIHSPSTPEEPVIAETVTESEETLNLDAPIEAEREIPTPTLAEPPAAPPEPVIETLKPKPASLPEKTVKKKLTLELVPETNKPQNKHSVDFDVSDLTPPLAEEPELNVADASSSPEPKSADAATSDDSVIDFTPSLEPVSSAPEEDKKVALKAKPESPETTRQEEKKTEAAESKSDVTETIDKPKDASDKSEASTKNEASPKKPESSSELLAVTDQGDNIPVLSEVVAPPARSKSKAKSKKPAPPLPAPDRAREIVVRAVAKLNVEMRKSGSAGLDTRTILRLQKLIREELEKVGGDK